MFTTFILKPTDFIVYAKQMVLAAVFQYAALSTPLASDPRHSDTSLLACLTYHAHKHVQLVLLSLNREEILTRRLRSTGCHMCWFEAEALNSLILIFYLFLLAVVEHSRSIGMVWNHETAREDRGVIIE